MNPGINLILPLVYDPSDGPFKTTKTLAEAIKQNIKLLFFTRKGDRVMDLNFGIGIREFLFENITEKTLSDIKETIYTQFSRYLPYVKIVQLVVNKNENNTLYIHMPYSVAGVTSLSYYEVVVKE